MGKVSIAGFSDNTVHRRWGKCLAGFSDNRRGGKCLKADGLRVGLYTVERQLATGWY